MVTTVMTLCRVFESLLISAHERPSSFFFFFYRGLGYRGFGALLWGFTV